MSHIVQIKTEVRELASIQAACVRNRLTEPVHGTVQLYSSAATGWQVQLPDWRYPVVCHTDTGQLSYDNYEGRWGDPVHLNSFLQSYAVEQTRRIARRQGYSLTEQRLSDGSVKLLLQTGGVA
ncbi:hypothetical protein Pla110_43850 [Polystyrenella longa]|uniref:DUF1257 domain-containing protein n=1 Tax=Polystyrenella longa TaxID=2528007 RepID=A0A518CTW2_9PLAN|nr:DUF1257 domain-containing protein [Polystyrenella longa]QDU82624.1 hypothetical protein Pla110_43850 [Polystyrenella longa]